MKSNNLTPIDEHQKTLIFRRPMVDVDLPLVQAQPSFLSAVKLCISMAGFDYTNQVYLDLGIDASHWTRIINGKAHFPLDKINDLMDLCGNEVPMLWLNHSRGYDLHSLRKLESETERALRIANERITELERDKRVLAEAIRGVGV